MSDVALASIVFVEDLLSLLTLNFESTGRRETTRTINVIQPTITRTIDEREREHTTWK